MKPDRVAESLVWLERRGTKRNRDAMLRYGIIAPKAFGVSVSDIKQLSKRLGTDHELALALWDAEWYEARMLAPFVDDPKKVTATQMNQWARAFDNWAVCDHVCFHLFDRTSHAWQKIEQWSGRRDEFVKRAAFALLASVALHDKRADDALFLQSLVLIERAAVDERNFVKKGVSWALRSVGRRNRVLNEASVATGRRLVDSPHDAARWIGRGALKELTGAVVRRQLAARERA